MRRSRTRCSGLASGRARRWFTPGSRGPYSHSLSDDERLYKTAAERADEAGRDPLVRMRALLRGRRPRDGRRPCGYARRRGPGDRRSAPTQALAADKPARHTAADWVFSPDVDPTSAAFDVAAEPHGKPDTMVSAINAALRDEMALQPARRRVRRGRRRLQPRGRAGGSVGQGRRVQGDARPAAALRRHAGVQLAAGRGQHRRTRVRHGHARHQAGRRDPVLRLHLAGDDADPRRDHDAALPLGQHVVVPDGDSRAHRRVSARRRAVPQPVRREHLRALPGHPRRLSLDRAGRRRAAADVDSLRRPGAVPGAQAPVPADVQQGRVPGPELHAAVRQRRAAPRRLRRRRRHLGRAGAADAAGGAAGGEGRPERRGVRPAHDHARTTGPASARW